MSDDPYQILGVARDAGVRDQGAVHQSAPPRPDGDGDRRECRRAAPTASAGTVDPRRNDTLAHEFVRLKKLGLIVDALPLDLIDARKLTRDRARRLDRDLDDLEASIRDVGLSNPIRVEAAAGGRYELIQGYRRLAAYRALFEETGDETYARIPAGLVAMGESLAGLYRRMVDENMVRKDISFAEMGSLARAYADDPQSEAADVDEAVAHLFASAGRQKRVYIRYFATLTGALEKDLEFPEAILRALGLALVKRLDDDPAFVAVIARALRDAPKRDAATEVALLQGLATAKLSPRGQLTRATPSRRGKTVLRLPTTDGMARCTAAG